VSGHPNFPSVNKPLTLSEIQNYDFKSKEKYMLQEMTMNEMQDVHGGIAPLVVVAVGVAVGAAATGIGAGVSMVVNSVRSKNPTSGSTVTVTTCTPKKP
jgi:lactobin A/cerein 7B family class IIb bacteriocin